MSSIYDTYISRLKEERLRLGYSQQAVATLCGVAREVWGRYEKGKNKPGGDVLFNFTKSGADINYIFTGVRVCAAPDNDEIDLILNAYAQTDAEGRAALLSVAKVIS